MKFRRDTGFFRFRNASFDITASEGSELDYTYYIRFKFFIVLVEITTVTEFFDVAYDIKYSVNFERKKWWLFLAFYTVESK